jgi:DNA polymerase III alpha subunit (gram-positive type)
MKFNIPKIIKPLDLSIYDESMRGIEIEVWVNPNRKMLDENQEIMNELAMFIKEVERIASADLDDDEKQKQLQLAQERSDHAMDRQNAWWATIFSQHSDDATHWTSEDIKILDEEDTALWRFVRTAAASMIRDHREGTKKG